MSENNKTISRASRLIIDGNYFFHRQVYGSKYKFKGTDGKSVSEEKTAFIKDCMMSLANLVFLLQPYIDGVEFVKDSGSWRKDVEIVSPYHREVNGYKGTREKSDEYDWVAAIDALEMFYQAIAKAADITIISYPKAEGDDAMYVRAVVLEGMGIPVLLWSSDNDTKCNVTDNISFLYDKTNTLYVSPSNFQHIYSATSDEDYMLMYGDSLLPLHLRAYRACTGGYSCVDTLEFMAEKLVVGDDGDNVPAIAYRFEPSERYGVVKYKPTSENISKALKEALRKSLIHTSCRDMNTILYDDNFICSFISNILSLEENYERRRDKALKDFTRRYKDAFKEMQPDEKPKKPKKGEEPAIVSYPTGDDISSFFFDEESNFITESYVKTDTGIIRNEVDRKVVCEEVDRYVISGQKGIFWDTKKDGKEAFESAFDTIYKKVLIRTFNHTDFNKTLRCFLSNRRMMMLNDKEIPQSIILGLKGVEVKKSRLSVAASFAELIKFLPSQNDRFWESRFVNDMPF